MAQLSCPLCCNETFSSHVSLKYHILGISDNLLCPSCNTRCMDLSELVSHLDKCQCAVRDVSDDSDGDVSSENKIKQDSDQERNEETEMVYTCEICNMIFSSVQEHVAKYHEGEEVLLETEDQEVVKLEHTSSDNDSETTESYLVETVSDNLDVSSKAKTRPVLPITEKYIIEEGDAKEINEEDAASIVNQQKVIQIHTCPNCDLQFPNLFHFNRHDCNANKIQHRKDGRSKIGKPSRPRTDSVSNEEVQYQCTFCLSVHQSLPQIKEHMKLHLDRDESGVVQTKTITLTPHLCVTCNTKFPTYKQLRLHSKMHEAKKTVLPINKVAGQNTDERLDIDSEHETFECPICNKVYDKEHQQVHMKFHEGDQFICLICNRKFESKDNLIMHANVHSRTKKFTCSYCKKSMSSYSALEAHIVKCLQYTLVANRDFECQFCGRRFARAHEKVKHERIHTGEKPHSCEICGKSFRVPYCLTLHMRTHTGSRPYHCLQCDKRFKSHSVFTHHQKIHSDDRNYKCNFCPKTFKTAVQLAGHKNSHTKPFSCTDCNRPFASLYAVKAHMETHKKDNNLKYKCGICGASYARSFALRDHISETHDKGDIPEEFAAVEANGEVEMTDGDSAMDQLSEEQIVSENIDYQETGTEDGVCHVRLVQEGLEGTSFVVRLDDASAANDSIAEDQAMEVLEG